MATNALQPYITREQARELTGNPPTGSFNPSDYASQPHPLIAARAFLKNVYGEWAVRIFDNVIAESYRGIKISDETLPDIAKKMQARNSLAKDKLTLIVSHMTQIKNARIGKGNPMAGYLDSMDYHA